MVSETTQDIIVLLDTMKYTVYTLAHVRDATPD